MKIKNIIKKYHVYNLGYVAIIGGIIVNERIKSGAPWMNIISSEFGNILFLIIVALVVELIIKIIKEND